MSARTLIGPSFVCLGILAVVLPATVLPLPPASAGDGDALVIVNGRPISRKTVVDKLLESHGLRMMQQLVALELAKQETRQRDLKVSEADVEAQFRRALEEIAPDEDAAGVSLTDQTKRQALERVLADRCVTMTEFMLAMERNAHLRKVVEGQVRVDEPTLREEFARTYGEKVEIRHIQVALNDAPALHEALDLLGRGVDFAEVAQRVSANPGTAAQGGLMEPFTFTDPAIPAAIREVAFSLKQGKRSNPTVVGATIHIIKLERRIPPPDVRFEDVREQVATRLRERVIGERMSAFMQKIFEQAQIRVLDRRLKREFEEMLQQNAPGQAPTP